jgi:hypothetical protein
MEAIAGIAYGDGAELGSFKVFSESLKQEISQKYRKIAVKYVNRDYDFVNWLISLPGNNEKITELHIFSHSIGAGLFIGYKDRSIASQRRRAFNNAAQFRRRLTYNNVLRIETGAIQTDDLVMNPLFIMNRNKLKNLFFSHAFIKIWGCNSGVSNWIYSDNNITDPNDTSQPYYWRAFNEKNKHKPSIAQALADFFQVKVYGARSGASIQVFHNKKWVSSKTYKQIIGHWPSGTVPHRLIPDRGVYNEFLPR